MSIEEFDGRAIDIGNRDKPLFPEAGLTKGDLIDYYDRVAPVMLPHIEGRPLTLQRFPDGIEVEGFFQQERGEYFPDWLGTVAVDHGGETGRVAHVVCAGPADLVFLANQGTIALHAWLSRRPDLDAPDRLIFDIDPPDGDFGPVRHAARVVGEGMRMLGLTPYPKTTGSRGVHVVAPIRPGPGFERVRGLARRLAAHLVARHPDTLTTEQRKAKRGGRLYLDVMRNAFGQTAVAPYSVRAEPGAPVATPLDWAELDEPDIGPRSYTIDNIFRRLGQKSDPWAGMDRHAVAVDTAEAAMDELERERQGGDS